MCFMNNKNVKKIVYNKWDFVRYFIENDNLFYLVILGIYMMLGLDIN